jgi:hypothetical protein
MKDFEIVAGVFIAVFILGIGMGVIVVIAMSALRHHRYSRRWDARGRGSESRYDVTRPWEMPPDDDDPSRPRWPHDGGFPG